MRTFKGGVHPTENKALTQTAAIRPTRLPSLVVIPLIQHIGAPCKALVNVGDKVKTGTLLGEPGGFISAAVHSSISGEVKAIEDKAHPVLGRAKAVVIEGDGKDELEHTIQPRASIEGLARDEIRAIIKSAGIVGLGGAAFPTHIKLSPPKEKRIDTFILNGVECEPFLTCDHRLMVERPAEIVGGMRLMMKALDVERGIIAIEKNKPDAIERMRDVVKDFPGLRVAALKVKYPQGAEKQLIYSLLGREVPSGGLPFDVGCVVQNVQTAFAVFAAASSGRPLFERVITVTGRCLSQPSNLSVRIGTLVRELLNECGGAKDRIVKLIAGGPMMGLAQYSLDTPVLKGTSGILALTKVELARDRERPCIRCGRCIQVCPAGIPPTNIASCAKAGEFAQAGELGVMDCIECGACSFVCLSRIPLAHYMKFAKVKVK